MNYFLYIVHNYYNEIISLLFYRELNDIVITKKLRAALIVAALLDSGLRITNCEYFFIDIKIIPKVVFCIVTPQKLEVGFKRKVKFWHKLRFYNLDVQTIRK